MADTPKILRVAVPRPLFQLLDYLPLEDSKPQVGSRVRIPFGHTEITGVILDIAEKSAIDQLKTITSLLDDKPLFDQVTLKLAIWASQYYHHPIGDVLTQAMPLALRGQRQIPMTSIWRIKDETQTDADTMLANAPKQLAVFNALRNAPDGMNEEQLKLQFGSSVKNTLREIARKSLIETKGAAFFFRPLALSVHAGKKPMREIELTAEQQSCLQQITEFAKDKKTVKPVLLHGVTGSGKTEIYLRSISAVLDRHMQVLVIVPEIGLTPQLLTRFISYFPEKRTVLMHSGLADSERMNAWLAAKTGQLDILIGTRSAIFVPLKKPGMIIVDEEHDASLKQQEGFRYHARDLAIKRAHDLSIPIILGSATPSLESIHNCDTQKYHYLILSKRPGSTVQPDILVQDIRGLSLDAGISQSLVSEIKKHLGMGNQAMLFLNRRGFAPALLCPQCGWHAQCPSCDANMTYHAHSHKLICHRCDDERAVNDRCPDCGHGHITTRGQGTERIERKLQLLFPGAPVIRIDRDTTSRKGELQIKLDSINKGNPCILVGTQMLAKGHDFPQLTLVGILDVDQSLFSTDFRAWERLSQLIVQVAGRAGRGEKKGTVMLQTSQPDHPFFRTLLTQGYMALARQTLEERRNWSFPPYTYQALIRANASEQAHALAFLQAIKELIAPYQSNDLSLLGPAPAPIEKRARRYRSQLLITAESRIALHQLLDIITQNSGGIRKKGGVRWSVDVDPIEYS